MLKSSSLGVKGALAVVRPHPDSALEPQGRGVVRAAMHGHVGRGRKGVLRGLSCSLRAELDFRVTLKGKRSSRPFGPHITLVFLLPSYQRTSLFRFPVITCICCYCPLPLSWPSTRSGNFILLSSVFCSKPWFLGRTPPSKPFLQGE